MLPIPTPLETFTLILLHVIPRNNRFKHAKKRRCTIVDAFTMADLTPQALSPPTTIITVAILVHGLGYFHTPESCCKFRLECGLNCLAVV